MDRMTKWTIFAGACAAAFCIWLRGLRTRPGAAGPATLRELLGELGGGLALFVVTLAEFATFDSPVSVPVLAAAAVTGLLIVFVLPLAQGLPPFALARLGTLRMRCPEQSLADLAINTGYADQAHMARDVHRLANIRPTELLRSAESTLQMSDLFKT